MALIDSEDRYAAKVLLLLDLYQVQVRLHICVLDVALVNRDVTLVF